ncbi:hypothetical protein LHJ74_09605 [Streptomyces sp. N2-109]|uniref:Uncharacterized protein n=1 Tax=Streptomyces gossypii TaxID=2883101 RepID=A0ABT2JRP2_9ACTN|nr:hypothetical protein [Streptomyces gossypii]MCT2590164.1 hypothetical protein [Streptomyces gossypii]
MTLTATGAPATTASSPETQLRAELPDSTHLVSRPVRWAATAAALTVLPTGLWRVSIALGAPSGFAEPNAMHDVQPGSFFSWYMIVLSLVAECFGVLALGLVQRWGEVLPHWVPLLGGRRVPTLAAVIPASAAALFLTPFTILCALRWNEPDTMGSPDAPTGTAATIMNACYAPMLLWGPLLAVVTIAYYRRRRAHG